MWLFWTQNEVVSLLTCASFLRLGNDGEPRYNSNVEVFTKIQHCQVIFWPAQRKFVIYSNFNSKKILILIFSTFFIC